MSVSFMNAGPSGGLKHSCGIHINAVCCFASMLERFVASIALRNDLLSEHS